MSHQRILADLEARTLLPPAQAQAIAGFEQNRPFSIHYELRALLYLGITLLAGGLGVLVYQNIDHIGHGVVVGFIALVVAACFWYAARHRQPFTWGEAPKASLLPDYALLLGCLTFLVLEGYLQYQYNIFGDRYGLVTMLPAALFLWLAYLFDHRGVLSMGLTALGTWVGVNVAPLSAFGDESFLRYGLGEAALGLGVVLMAAGLLSEYLNLKRHFAFTYLSLGSNVALLAATAILFGDNAAHLPSGLMVPLIFILSGFLFWYARRTQSYLFLLLGVIYSYIVLTYLLIQLVADNSGAWEFLIMFYFPLSAIGAVLLFVNIRKILRIHAD
ncbi:DUF2157 domain-containing protein [Hymenobacter sp. ASUV-10]|uniref:DUF2157 domain-containing protein n=1 Tax=Hymenobacter aranciens TaxID=3063996 RepID=A0ABT9BD92_9BACT|nr:DUF2157 domain-containing protein [Hymenobacter sp. ASUV-10]MDO7875007.1 DUF2157 domain-containing protein [Hymenobacter sp. ASUV-10]